jgi:hypothetical protein
VTGVFVRTKGRVGIVPIHPLDEKGKPARNLEHGVFSPVLTKGMSEQMTGGDTGQKWETLKSAPREALTGGRATVNPPTRTSRTIAEGNSNARFVSHGNDSSIAYDARERRFVNNKAGASSSTVKAGEFHTANGQSGVVSGERSGNVAGRAPTPVTGGASARAPAAPPTTRNANPPSPARNMSPPPAPRYSGGSQSGSSGRGSSWGGSSSSGGSGGSSGRSSSGSSSGSPSRSSGGRPH